MRKPLTPLAQRLGVFVDARHLMLARVEPVRPGDHLQQQRVVGDVRGHRPGGVDGDLQRPDAGVGHEPEGRLHADDAAVARRDADRAGLVAADRHRHVAGGDQRGAAATTSRRW